MQGIKINSSVLEKTVGRAREKNIILPTFSQQKNPDTIPQKIKEELKDIGLWDINSRNLFRITWKNNPKEAGGDGLFGGVNFIELPREITGIKARVIGLVGKYFPTGSHKVGAAYGCLAPRLVTGEFDPTSQKAVWPSTGNYCRGGAFDSVLLGCASIAILPQGMSRERFEWLESVGSEVIATPGTESNVKEIYDKCWELRRTRKDIVIFNQFDEFGNSIWHYHMTGSALEEVYDKVKTSKSRFAAYCSATGSAGTIAAGDYLRKKHPLIKVVASEALQCPTILLNGFGEHRIEGIGDKHIPWIHNIRNTDAVTAIDDEDCIRLMRLFNELEGQKALGEKGIKKEIVEKLKLLGISSISNMLSAIKTAKYFEYGEDDIIFTVFTDSMDLYQSRLKEVRKQKGAYKRDNALIDFEGCIEKCGIDYIKELSYYERKAVHNLKYFTWVEQQEKNSDDLKKMWHPEFWDEKFSNIDEWDKRIEDFNERVGLLK
ncbi:MAG: pyridoxal-phosphate dependent enzyme [Elusimicrobia bacterium]|nr:pyridoxal-phosphate dependent enzyme [Candidatus Omnitrophota bacterium]MCG2725319.1 pyridoxal-phosphate dependent enzyme [Elusimicrobiota bacterium]